MIEELKIIMETLGTATGAAKQFGIFWLSIECARLVFAYVLGGAGLYAFVQIIHKIINAIKDSNDEVEFAYSLRRMVLPKAYGSIYEHEKLLIAEAVQRGIKASKD